MLLAYWKIRGLAQPIRLLLAHVGASWEDRYYPTGPAPAYDKSEWYAEKGRLGLAFPNLPYLIDGDLRLTESHAILRHLDRRFGLLPAEPVAHAVADNLACVLADLSRAFIHVCYADEFEALRRGYAAGMLAAKLAELEAFLSGRGDGFVVGQTPSYADFLLYETMEQHRALAPEAFAGMDAIRAHAVRVEALPGIAAYRASDRFLAGPINNRMAKFGG